MRPNLCGRVIGCAHADHPVRSGVEGATLIVGASSGCRRGGRVGTRTLFQLSPAVVLAPVSSP